MTRTFRGVWSRRGTLLPLLLLTTVVVAGVVAVIGFADGAGTSTAVAVPLLLLGLVAVPATGRQLAAVRRDEIAIARLRGITGGHLYAVLASEPLLVLATGALLGVVAGVGVSWLAGRLWVDATATSLSLSALPAVVAVVGVGLVAVLAGMAGALREPLRDQVSVAERPRAASTTALFGSVLVLVAAVVAVYRSTVADTADPDWVVLAGPALVGLAVGQVTVWLVRIGAGIAVGRTAAAKLPGFLAARRLARSAETATPIRLVVAAAVVAAVSLTGAQQVDDWAEATSRLRAGAPVRVDLDRDAAGVLKLTHRLDPDGRWLMAAVLVPGEGSVPARRAFLDTARYDAVVGDFFAGTAAAGVAEHLDDLAGADRTVVTEGTVRATVRGVSRRLSGTLRPRVTVRYVDEHGRSSTVTVPLRVDRSGGPTTAEVPLTTCAGGCAVVGLSLDRADGDAELPFVLTGLEFGGVDALDRGWRPPAQRLPAGMVIPEITEVDDGLLAPPSDEPLIASSVGGTARLPVLATDTAVWPEETPEVGSTGGDVRTAQVLDRMSALPLVEADGVLADLPRAAAGASPTVPAALVMVLARGNTPAPILSALTDAADREPLELAQAADAVAAEAGAAQARVYALMAVFCLAVALLVVAASISRQRSAHDREVAGLRVVGVPLRQLRRSGRLELVVLASAALAAAVAGGVAAVRLLLSNLSLVTVPLHAVPLQIGLSPVPIVVAALAAALLVLVVGGRSRGVRSEQGRPAILREEGA